MGPRGANLTCFGRFLRALLQVGKDRVTVCIINHVRLSGSNYYRLAQKFTMDVVPQRSGR